MTNSVREFASGELTVGVYENRQLLGQAAAAQAATTLQTAIAERGSANAILATGNSQLTLLAELRRTQVDWSRVTLFHMDEYIGLPSDHPAGFRRFLHKRIVDAVRPAAFHGIDGNAADIPAECRRYADLLQRFPADLCCLGIGENGHLAFNDPPFADFEDKVRVKVVELDAASRRQQVGEGHFASLDLVPRQAITLTIPALLTARRLLCVVPEARKADAVKAALTGPITTRCPASILRTAPHATLFLDRESSMLL